MIKFPNFPWVFSVPSPNPREFFDINEYKKLQTTVNDQKLFLDSQNENLKLLEHQNDKLTQELEDKETIVKRHLEILRSRNTVIRSLTKQIYELKDEQNNVDNLNWHIRQLLEGIKWGLNRSFLFNKVQISKTEEPKAGTEGEAESSD